SLRGVISQQLLRTSDGNGRVAALEILINTPAVANLIRQGKLEQLENVMQSGGADGMCTMDHSLKQLLSRGRVAGREAYLQAIDKSKFAEFKDQD
ncbi:MAG TPA: type IV pili twitching motility protein PilT, partial [Gammaproteobacteria bacterium]|nr:type IV pili twitching motility protein PilT [Gammaproteobacteria bacterium]